MRCVILLGSLNLTGVVVTADALHAPRGHAEFLVEKKTHYIVTVKDNQPTLHAQLKNLPWRQIPTGHTESGRGHGRQEQRALKVTSVARGLSFPHPAQAIQVRRRRRPLGTSKWSTETACVITSLAAHQASPADLVGWMRGALADRGPAPHPRRHLWRRHIPDPHRQRPPRHGHPPQRHHRNPEISGHTSIAAARRYHARDVTRTLTTLGLSPP